MLKKIIDITFWVSFLSTITHFYVWVLVRDASDTEFAKDALNATLLSASVTTLAYWVSKPPVNSDSDNNY